MLILNVIVAIYLCSIAGNAIILWVSKTFYPEEYRKVMAGHIVTEEYIWDVALFYPVINTVAFLALVYILLIQDFVMWIRFKIIYWTLLRKLSPKARRIIKKAMKDEHQNENQSSDDKATSLEERPESGEKASPDEHKPD